MLIPVSIQNILLLWSLELNQNLQVFIMLTILQKKKLLPELLQDFTDIHCHLIHDIDDGPKTLESSFQLIKKTMDMGISGFISTPHIMADMYPNTPQLIGAKYDQLKEHLIEKDSLPKVFKVAAEYMVDDNFESQLDDKNLLLLSDRYVLIEFPFIQIPMNIEFIIDSLFAQEYIPVLAHPERYRYFHHQGDFLTLLKQKGCKFQINALSLSTYYGNSIHKAAMQLLDEGFYSFLGTDIHNELHLSKLSEIRIKKNAEKLIVPLIENTKNIFS